MRGNEDMEAEPIFSPVFICVCLRNPVIGMSFCMAVVTSEMPADVQGVAAIRLVAAVSLTGANANIAFT